MPMSRRAVPPATAATIAPTSLAGTPLDDPAMAPCIEGDDDAGGDEVIGLGADVATGCVSSSLGSLWPLEDFPLARTTSRRRARMVDNKKERLDIAREDGGWR